VFQHSQVLILLEREFEGDEEECREATVCDDDQNKAVESAEKPFFRVEEEFLHEGFVFFLLTVAVERRIPLHRPGCMSAVTMTGINTE